MNQNAIELKNVKKKYKLGSIGGGTLKGDIESWIAKKMGKEDPNSIVGDDHERIEGDSFWALRGVDLEIKKGEAIGIIGSNGAGKSTLLKLLSRITAPTEGSIDVWGRISSMLEVGTGFHGELTGRENIYLNGAILGMSKKEIDSKINRIIDFSEVGEFIDTPVKRYSSGMYVKLAFSVAAHLDSEILIMDEVLAVGDVAFQKKCLSKMSSIANDEKRTILYVSHNMSTIRDLCSRCVVLNKGRKIFDGDVESGIQEYLGTYQFMQSNEFYLSDLDRLERSLKKAHIVSIKYENAKNGIIQQGDKLKCTIDLRVYEDLYNVQIRITFSDKLGNHMATGLSEVYDIIPKSNSRKLSFTVDVSMFIPEEYCCYIGIYNTNAVGTFEEQDLVNRPFYLKIVGSSTIKQPKNWWDVMGKGYIRIPDFDIN